MEVTAAFVFVHFFAIAYPLTCCLLPPPASFFSEEEVANGEEGEADHDAHIEATVNNGEDKATNNATMLPKVKPLVAPKKPIAKNTVCENEAKGNPPLPLLSLPQS